MEDHATEKVSTDSTDSKTTSRKRLRQTTGSQTDEECDGDHWSEASVRLANLEAKMDKFLDLFSEIATLKDRLKIIEDENKDLKKPAENAKEELQELNPAWRSYARNRRRGGAKTYKGDGADKVPKHQTRGLYEKGKHKDIQSQRNRR